MSCNDILQKINENEIVPSLSVTFSRKYALLNQMQNSDEIQGSISYNISKPQFKTLPSGMMLHSMQLPMLKELMTATNIHQFNKHSTTVSSNDSLQVIFHEISCV